MVELFELFGTIRGDTSGLEKSIDRSRKVIQDLKDDLAGLDKTKISPRLGGGFGDAEKAAAKATGMINRYDVSLAKLAGRQTELLKLNQLLSQPGVAAKIDGSTQAILRQKAALIDSQRAASQAAAAQSKFASSGSNFGSSFGGNIAAVAVSKLTSELSQGGSAVFAYTAALEQARIGFTTLTGSVGSATQHIVDLQNFAKKTPFDFAGLVKASTLLQGVGIQSERIIPILEDVGNRLSAAGKGNEEISRTVLALSQMAAKGKLAGQEINQLAENGVPAVAILSQALGKTKAEVIALSEDGQISFDLFLAALDKANKQNNLGDAMERQSHTFNGALSNIKDALFQFSESAFRPLFTQFAGLADNLAKEVSKQDADFRSIGGAMGKAITEGLGAAIAAGASSIKAELIKEFKDLFEELKKGQGFNVSTPQSFGSSLANSALGFAGKKPLFDIPKEPLQGFIDNYNAQLRTNEQTRRLLAKIQSEKSPFSAINQEKQGYNKFANALGRGKLVPDGAIIIKQDVKSIQYLDKVTNTIKTIANEASKTPSIADLLAGGNGKGGAGTGRSKANPFAEIQDFIKGAGFTPGSAYRPGGPNGATDHAGRGAVDVSVKANPGKSVEDFTRLIIGALEKGKQVIDERIVGFHKGIKSTGPNVHIGNSPNKSFFLDQSKYSVPVDYLKELDAKRRNRKGLDVDTAQISKDFNEKLSRALEDASNKATKDFKDKFIERSIDVYKILGIIPTGEVLSDFQAKFADEAKKTGGRQLTAPEISAQFSQNAQNKAPELTTTQAPILEKFTAPLPPTLDESFLNSYKEQLGIVEAIQEVIFKTTNYEATVGLQAVSAIVNQRRDLQQAGIEFDTAAKLNADALFVSQRRQLSALLEINALQKEYADLQDESFNLGNKILNQDRQRNRILSERNGLSREIQDLQAEVASGGANDALKVQAALLRDILELRNRELDAQISINRSRLEINDKLTVHSDQIKARTLEVLASQKSITDIFSDAQTGAIEDAFAGVDSGVHALAKGLGIADGAAKRFFETIVGGLLKLGLNKVFTKLFDPQGEGGGDIFGELLGIPKIIKNASPNKGVATEAAKQITKEATKATTESTAATVLLGTSGERTAGALAKTAEGAALLEKEMARLAATCAKAAKDCGCDGEKKEQSSGGGLFGKILGAVIGAAGSALGGAITGRGGGSVPVDGTGTPTVLPDDVARASGDAGLSSVKKSFAQSTSSSIIEKAAAATGSKSQTSGGTDKPAQIFNFYFQPNKETGAFSKDSAFQVAKKTAGILREATVRE